MMRCPPRLVGLLLLVASAATTAIHRSVWESARHGPPQVVELALGLSTFALASVGMLLLIHGGTLVRRARDDMASGIAPGPGPLTRILDALRPGGRAFDTRRGVAAMQARAALVDACVAHRSSRPASGAPRHLTAE